MDFQSNDFRVAVNLDGKAEITFIADKRIAADIEELRGKELSVRVSLYSPRRSMTQNAYLWVLLGDLANRLGISKTEAYRHFIKDYGQYVVMPLRDDAVEQFCRVWQARGLGWVCEPIRASKLMGYTNVMAFYGSSSYNRKEMGRLLDAVVEACVEQGIPTLNREQRNALQNENEA